MGEHQGDSDANQEKGTGAPQSPEELIAAIDSRLKLVESKVDSPSALFGRSLTAVGSATVTIVNSGVFFMVLGGCLLFLAQKYMPTNHAGITFVLVVLGVALILYGTGTQGAGQLNSSAEYNIAIAGGAGVVAFAVAYGMIRYSTDMRNAFQPERKFVRVFVQGGDGLTDITKYASTFEMDGSPIPAAPAGNKTVEIYIPYLPFEITRSTSNSDASGSNSDAKKKVGETAIMPILDDLGMCTTEENREAAHQLDQHATPKVITARFHRVQGKSDDRAKSEDSQDFLVRLDERIFRSTDGGVEFPKYPVKFCINLQNINPDTDTIAQAQRAEIARKLPGALNSIPNALIAPQ
jgi:hypothetical protein